MNINIHGERSRTITPQFKKMQSAANCSKHGSNAWTLTSPQYFVSPKRKMSHDKTTNKKIKTENWNYSGNEYFNNRTYNSMKLGMVTQTRKHQDIRRKKKGNISSNSRQRIQDDPVQTSRKDVSADISDFFKNISPERFLIQKNSISKQQKNRSKRKLHFHKQQLQHSDEEQGIMNSKHSADEYDTVELMKIDSPSQSLVENNIAPKKKTNALVCLPETLSAETSVTSAIGSKSKKKSKSLLNSSSLSRNGKQDQSINDVLHINDTSTSSAKLKRHDRIKKSPPSSSTIRVHSSFNEQDRNVKTVVKRSSIQTLSVETTASSIIERKPKKKNTSEASLNSNSLSKKSKQKRSTMDASHITNTSTSSTKHKPQDSVIRSHPCTSKIKVNEQDKNVNIQVERNVTVAESDLSTINKKNGKGNAMVNSSPKTHKRTDKEKRKDKGNESREGANDFKLTNSLLIRTKEKRQTPQYNPTKRVAKRTESSMSAMKLTPRPSKLESFYRNEMAIVASTPIKDKDNINDSTNLNEFRNDNTILEKDKIEIVEHSLGESFKNVEKLNGFSQSDDGNRTCREPKEEYTILSNNSSRSFSESSDSRDLIIDTSIESSESGSESNNNKGQSFVSRKELTRENCTIYSNEIFSELCVEQPENVAPLHLIETRISTAPSKEQQEEIDALGITLLRKALYTEAEDNILKSNWLKFCEKYDIPNDPAAFLHALSRSGKIKVTNRLIIMRHLAEGLPNRLLHSVYKRFQCLYIPRRKGKYTKEEDMLILSMTGKKRERDVFSILSKHLHRNAIDIRRHYLCLIKPRIEWNFELNTKFIELIIKATKVKDVKDLETRKITSKEWDKIQRKMKIPRYMLKWHWRRDLYSQLFVDPNLSVIDVQKRIINCVADVIDQKSINWKELASKFKGLTSHNINEIYIRLVKEKVPSTLRKKPKDCADFLQNFYFPLQSKRSFFKKLVYESGNLYEMSRKRVDREVE